MKDYPFKNLRHNHVPNDSLGFLCTQTRKCFLSAMERRLVGSGMNTVQYIAIGQLLNFGSLTQSELAESLSVTLATMTRLVDRMERDGWVIRKKDENDARVKYVVPTKKVAEIWDKVSHIGFETIEKAYRGISKEDLETTKRVLAQARQNLQ